MLSNFLKKFKVYLLQNLALIGIAPLVPVMTDRTTQNKRKRPQEKSRKTQERQQNAKRPCHVPLPVLSQQTDVTLHYLLSKELRAFCLAIRETIVAYGIFLDLILDIFLLILVFSDV